MTTPKMQEMHAFIAQQTDALVKTMDALYDQEPTQQTSSATAPVDDDDVELEETGGTKEDVTRSNDSSCEEVSSSVQLFPMPQDPENIVDTIMHQRLGFPPAALMGTAAEDLEGDVARADDDPSQEEEPLSQVQRWLQMVDAFKNGPVAQGVLAGVSLCASGTAGWESGDAGEEEGSEDADTS
jgi:hypothetical protein